MSKTHKLKCWPPYFEAVRINEKPFEIRKNDRDFTVGDLLHLQEFDPELGLYSGRECFRFVTYITDWQQMPGNIVMGIKPA